MAKVLGLEWGTGDKPDINHWYMLRDWSDRIQIRKDYKMHGVWYYKIVTYYNADQIHCGKPLIKLRQLVRQMTFRAIVVSVDNELK